MAKLYFRYGAMNSGKTTVLLQVAHNYEERGMKVVILKAAIDTKGEDKIVSRMGISRKVDYLVKESDDINKWKDEFIKNNVSCILVDEAQFLTAEQINQLWEITKIENIPVICYGLRTDFKTNGFPGSIRLLELSDELEEIITICRCGKRARFNGRKIKNEFVNNGSQIAIDEKEGITYESLCGKCYIEKVLKCK